MYKIRSPPDPSFDLSRDLSHAPSFSTRSHLVQNGVLLNGKISLAKFPQLVKFEYFIYVRIVFQLS